MSGGITVREFKHIPGVNDAEYIKILEELNEINQRIINKAVAKIKMLSAQLERKKGTWTKDASCPFCGFQPWYEKDIHTLSFCPHCGADLRGERDE